MHIETPKLGPLTGALLVARIMNKAESKSEMTTAMRLSLGKVRGNTPDPSAVGEQP